MASIGALSVPGVLNIYDEEESVRWGDPPGQATRRRRRPAALPGIALVGADRAGGRSPRQERRPSHGSALHLDASNDRGGSGRAHCHHRPACAGRARTTRHRCCCGTHRSCSPRTTGIPVGRRSTPAPTFSLSSAVAGGSWLSVAMRRWPPARPISVTRPTGGVPCSPTGSVPPCPPTGFVHPCPPPPFRRLPPEDPGHRDNRLGDVTPKHPVGTLDGTMRSQPIRHRRDSPPPRTGAPPLVAEYKILVEPPHPVRRAVIVAIVVVAVVAVGVGAFTLGRHNERGGHGRCQRGARLGWPTGRRSQTPGGGVLRSGHRRHQCAVEPGGHRPVLRADRRRRDHALLRSPRHWLVDQGGLFCALVQPHRTFHPDHDRVAGHSGGECRSARPFRKDAGPTGVPHLHRGSGHHRAPAAIAGAARLPTA